MALSSKESTIEDWVRAIDKDGMSLAIVNSGDQLMRLAPMKDYIDAHFTKVVFTWTDPYVGNVELRRRTK